MKIESNVIISDILNLKNKSNEEIRSLFAEASSVVRYDWEIHENMGGMGGCKTLDEWIEDIYEDPIEQAVKLVFKEYIKDDANIREYFLQYIWNLVCSCQIDILFMGRGE